MIVLRITADGRSWNIERTEPRVLLGTAAEANVREDGVGWRPAEAVLHHRGTEVLLERPNEGTQLRLRVGDGVRLGRARITLIGILPLPAEVNPAGEPPPVFGGYDDAEVAGAGFDLAPPPSGVAGSVPDSRTVPASGSTPPSASAPASGSATSSAGAATRPSAPTGTPRPPRSPTRGVVPAPRPPAPAFRNEDFGSELVTQIRRAPFFVLSVAVHTLVFLLFTMLQTRADLGAENRANGTLMSGLLPPDAEQTLPDDEAEGDELALPEIPELPEPVLPDPFTLMASEQDSDDATMRLDPLPPASVEANPLVGLNPSVVNARARKGKTDLPTPDVDLRQTFVKGTSTGANQLAADFVRAQLGRGRGTEGSRLDALAKKDILVVDGSFDRIGRVLHALHLPYTLVTPISVSLDNAPPLDQHKIVFWNCGESLSPPRRKMAARRIREFVRSGGYLFTTDWAIGNILIHAFPEFLGTSGPIAPLPECVVDIEPARGQARHPLLRGVFLPGVQGEWWLEQASFDVKVKRGRDVTVLIESEELKKDLKREPGVAVVFPYGRGKVLHVMGHYFQEQGNMAGTIAAHRLALNFVIMRLQADERPTR